MKEIPGECWLCRDKMESALHVLRECPRAADIWESSGLNILHIPCGPDVRSWVEMAMDELDQLERRWFAMTCWAIWGARNRWIFQGEMDSTQEVLTVVSKHLTDCTTTKEKKQQNGGSLPDMWRPPSVGAVKINVDAGRVGEQGTCLGIVCRQSDGRIVVAATYNLVEKWAIVVAEAKAALLGLQVAHTYGYTNECEHPLAPRQRKYVRVALYSSGWRIRQVPGTNACEIKMVHQEDAGLNEEVAKLVFAKGIWGYVGKMNDALRKYTSLRPQSSLAITAVSLIQKVPPKLEAISRSTSSDLAGMSGATVGLGDSRAANPQRITRRPSRKLIANGLLLVGGLICLSHCNTGLGSKVAAAFILKKLCKRGTSSNQVRASQQS